MVDFIDGEKRFRFSDPTFLSYSQDDSENPSKPVPPQGLLPYGVPSTILTIAKLLSEHEGLFSSFKPGFPLRSGYIVGAIAGTARAAIKNYTEYSKGNISGHWAIVDTVSSGLIGATAGALGFSAGYYAGGVLGSVIPGAGTLLGGVIGGGVGWFVGGGLEKIKERAYSESF